MSSRHFLPLVAAATLIAATPPASSFKSPAWLSIETPVNPYNPATRGAVVLVHTQLPTGITSSNDLTGTAEGLVSGARRSIPIRFDSLAQPNTYGVRRQWPTDGTWLLRVNFHGTTALVSFDAAGNVTTRVPTELSRGMTLPRAVAAMEIDSALVAAARR